MERVAGGGTFSLLSVRDYYPPTPFGIKSPCFYFKKRKYSAIGSQNGLVLTYVRVYFLIFKHNLQKYLLTLHRIKNEPRAVFTKNLDNVLLDSQYILEFWL